MSALRILHHPIKPTPPDTAEVCATCRDRDSQPMVWPCPTAVAFGLTDRLLHGHRSYLTEAEYAMPEARAYVESLSERAILESIANHRPRRQLDKLPHGCWVRIDVDDDDPGPLRGWFYENTAYTVPADPITSD